MSKVHLRVYRGNSEGGQLKDYDVEVDEGMVVLYAIHRLQATQASDLACRWNFTKGRQMRILHTLSRDQRQAAAHVYVTLE